jgi:transcriptional regulator with XRE-family HTH domain
MTADKQGSVTHTYALDANAVRLAFGRRLRVLRAEQGVSQYGLSRSSGVHPTEVSRMERGERDPRLTTILRLADGLGVPPGALVEDQPATHESTVTQDGGA